MDSILATAGRLITPTANLDRVALINRRSSWAPLFHSLDFYYRHKQLPVSHWLGTPAAPPASLVTGLRHTGQSDLVWESARGAHVIWILNNRVFQYPIRLPNVGGGWHVVGAGDFNGGGQNAFVWEDATTGLAGIWILTDCGVVLRTNLGQ